MIETPPPPKAQDLFRDGNNASKKSFCKVKKNIDAKRAIEEQLKIFTKGIPGISPITHDGGNTQERNKSPWLHLTKRKVGIKENLPSD